MNLICVSIVSHGHGLMATDLIAQVQACPEVAQIIWTRNVPERALPTPDGVELIDNARPKGFGANHNAAFAHCTQPLFCVLNPDIDWAANPFPRLLDTMSRERASLIAPEIRSPHGHVEDSMRHYPTVQSLLAKAVRGDEGRAPLPPDGTLMHPDWVAGMFMLLRADDFRAIGGFDESYFLYYEDIELCAQLTAAGKIIIGDLAVHATHRARRASRSNFQHFCWHIASMIRYLWRHSFDPRITRQG